MEDPDQVQSALARFAVGAEQIFGTQLVARALRAGVAFSAQRNDASVDQAVEPSMAPQHSFGKVFSAWATIVAHAGLLIRIISGISPQKRLAQIFVGAVAEHGDDHAALARVRHLARHFRAATNIAPDEIPTSSPSSRASQRTMHRRPRFRSRGCRRPASGRRCPARSRSACASSLPVHGIRTTAARKCTSRRADRRVSRREFPVKVPLVPMLATKCVMRPSVCSMISSAVPRSAPSSWPGCCTDRDKNSGPDRPS